jgi:hypothetical protein
MPFWSPFATVGKRFIENKSSGTIKLILCDFMDLYKQPLANPFGWLTTRLIGEIH